MIPEIAAIRDEIVRGYGPDKIILFGSHARGEAKLDSDIDLVILSDRERGVSWAKRGFPFRLSLFKYGKPLDLLFYTHEEFHRFGEARQSLASTILREGVVLYEAKPA